MNLIEFQNYPSTETPINAKNLNYNFSHIVESGSNENGSWIKWADGTMICRRTITKVINCSTAWGNLYYGNDNTEYKYAQSFIEEPQVSIDVVPNAALGFFKGGYEKANVGTNAWSGYSILRPTSTNDVQVKVFVIAIGRWK